MKITDFALNNPVLEKIEEQSASLRMECTTGSMWGAGNSCENLLLHVGLSTELSASVDVTIMPGHNGEQAGLVFYQDDDNYIKFVREYAHDKHFLVFAREVEGQPEALEFIDYVDAQVHLEMQLHENAVTISWPGNSKSFNECSVAGAQYQVGLFVHGNNPGNYATFSGFKVSAS